MTIPELLEQYDMNMAELSRRFEIPYRTVQDWAVGRRQAPPDVINLIEKCLRYEGSKPKINEIEILKSTGMTEFDAKKHIKMGVTIYEVDDCLKHFESVFGDFEGDEKENLRAFLMAKKDGSRLWDNDLTICDGTAYYIEYCL